MTLLDAPADPVFVRREATGSATSRLRLSACATIATPLGAMLLARSPIGLAGVWFAGQRYHPGVLDVPDDPTDPLLRRAADQLRRYFEGAPHGGTTVDGTPVGAAPTGFDVPLDLQGTPFQRAVWQALLGIGVGTTTSYAAIARQLGAARAVRAVGGAVGRNPVSVIVPCHRVVGSDGSLTGYAGGTHRKQSLLALEGVTAHLAARTALAM